MDPAELSHPSPISAAASPKSPEPRLGRIDGQLMEKVELNRRRFGITVESVSYYPSEQGIGCAVLLKACFELPGDEHLAKALVPLSASRSKQDDTAADINISTSYPSKAQWFEVKQQVGTKDIEAVPSVKLNILGNGVELSGVGWKKHSDDDHSYKISLDNTRTVLENHPTYLHWNFKDEKGVFYPPNINLLVVVEKCTPDYAPSWFPFQLNLDWQLQVDVHGKIFKRFLRLVAAPSKHDGWCFQIKGQYYPQLAEKALNDALSEDIPSHVGLHAAAKAWLEAKNPPNPKGKQKAT